MNQEAFGDDPMETGPSESFRLTPGEDGPLKEIQNISTQENPPSCGAKPASQGSQESISWAARGEVTVASWRWKSSVVRVKAWGWKRRPSPSFHATSGWVRDMAVNNEGANHETLVRKTLDGCDFSQAVFPHKSWHTFLGPRY